MAEAKVKLERDDTPMTDVDDWTLVDVPAVDPATTKLQMDHIKTERESLKQVLIKSKQTKGFPNPTQEQLGLLKRLDDFLVWLELKLHMTPEVERETKVGSFVNQVYNPMLCLPQAYAAKVEALHKTWLASNWGEVKKEVKRESDSDSAVEGSESPPKRARASAPGYTTSHLPPPQDPLWGLNGIMHGIAIRTGADGRRSNFTDPRYKREKREAKVFGHNGLENGAWYPFRLNAIFHGAHGASQAGISGDLQTGAYSIVVSNLYHEFDEDLGNTIVYCGAGGNDNIDPNRAAKSTGTEALRASRQNGQSVRVLRTASGRSAWAPRAGLRYDGLYRVVSVNNTQRNRLGGMVETFKLVRLDNQQPIDLSRPTAQEVRDLERVPSTTIGASWTSKRE
ncbi:uncharacterized protein LTR77_011060 [Saxophila tyrrhenica]|uniref:YDG domain-containing protein n=1 Tax=Saxophila tyrrhenica TaxID=1690608 RepID=A0AAV9NW30_9PEZI|nr:hypothetical protein LTR77_011060 [Saxophila tyrrhenica]